MTSKEILNLCHRYQAWKADKLSQKNKGCFNLCGKSKEIAVSLDLRISQKNALGKQLNINHY